MAVPVMAVPVMVVPVMTPVNFCRLQAIDVVLQDHRGFRTPAARWRERLFN